MASLVTISKTGTDWGPIYKGHAEYYAELAQRFIRISNWTDNPGHKRECLEQARRAKAAAEWNEEKWRNYP